MRASHLCRVSKFLSFLTFASALPLAQTQAASLPGAEAFKALLVQKCGPASQLDSLSENASPKELEAVADRFKAFDDAVEKLDDGDARKAAIYKKKLQLALEHCWTLQSTAFRALEDIADVYESNEQYEQAIVYRTQEIGLFAYFGATKDWGLGETRLQLADHLEALSRFPEAETQIRESIINQDGLGDAGVKASKVRLAENLNHQHRYKEAETILIALGKLENLAIRSGEAKFAFGEAIEGQGRLSEAEAIWRQFKIDDRLLANLKLQGKASQAADLMASIDSREEASKPTQDDAATVLVQRELMLEYAKELEKQGNRVGAKAMRDSAAMIGAAPKAAPTPRGGISKTPVEVAATVAQAQPGIDSVIAVPFPNERQIERATLLFEAGRFSEAAPLLLENCPKTIQMLPFGLGSTMSAQTARINDISKRLIPDGKVTVYGSVSNQISTQDCYKMLTVSQMALAGKAEVAFSEEEFASAQYATLSAAGLALTQSGARKYAERTGILPNLLEIEKINESIFASKAFKDYIQIAEEFSNVVGTRDYSVRAPDIFSRMMTVAAKWQPAQAQLDSKTQALRAQSPEYFALREPKPVTLAALQTKDGPDRKLLGDDEALILWMWSPQKARGMVYAVTKTRSARVEMGLSSDAIAERVARLRTQIDPCSKPGGPAVCTAPSEKSFDRQAAWELHSALLGAPAIQAIISPKAITKLVIVPSGPLIALPPAMLITEQPEGGVEGDKDPGRMVGESWLIRSKSIAVLPGISALRTLRDISGPTRASQAASLYMLANPDYSGMGKGGDKCVPGARSAPRAVSAYFTSSGGSKADLARLRNLPCTLEEGLAIQKLVGGNLYTGLDASEARLRAPGDKLMIAKAGLIAFATHGLVAGDLGLGEPALALAQPATNAADDGFLTASEILSMKLSAEWVILSACNTASPDAAYADGLSGLSRAFFAAGAKSMLVSHWRVDDVATRVLITQAVALHQRGVAKADALRQASLSLMRGELGITDGSQAFPSAWAPFALMGEPN